MLDSLLIKNFRLFKHLEVKKLSRLNLIVGRNNSGKSTFLEAVNFYINNSSPQVLLNLIGFRQENLEPMSMEMTDDDFSRVNPIRHLFYNHNLPKIDEEGIRVGSLLTEQKQLHVFLSAFRLFTTEEGAQIRRIPIKPDEIRPEDEPDIEVNLMVTEGDQVKRVFRMGENRSLERDIRRGITGPTSPPQCPIEVVSTGNFTSRKLASLWDRVAGTDFADQVISCLQLIDPTVSDIAFIQSDEGRERFGEPPTRFPIVRKVNVSERLPLRTSGDGVVRLFHIALALVNAKNGILLIDEFENGLHWSVQPKIWKAVFQLAVKLNVQVFATTHSRDCVRAFGEAWEGDEELGNFFRLNLKPDGQVTTTLYSCETLADSLETEVEVR